MPDVPLRLARWTARTGALAAAAFAFGPLLAHLAITAPMTGFILYLLGGLLGLIAVVLGLIALARGPAASRRLALRGSVPALFVLLVLIVSAARGGNHPRINDITTDTENPPRFVKAPTLPGNEKRDMSYPGVEFARQQRAGYPDLAPLRLSGPPDETFGRVAQAARGMPGWTITRSDPHGRSLEGYDTSWLFRFNDDFVIEIRSDQGGSAVHMRSKSRDGRGDLGANAKRIRAFFAKLRD
jgi:uncharacterized protein (DUF1499 family)